MLLSQRTTMCRCLLFEQHLRHPLRSHLLIGTGLVSALNERQLDAMADRRGPTTLLSQAAPQELGHRILQSPVLLDRADLYRAHQVIGQVERRLHRAMIPASWFSGSPLNPVPRSPARSPAAAAAGPRSTASGAARGG